LSKYIKITTIYIALFTLIFSCSREVNNAYTRFHHNLNTYYNVYFNQKEYYNKGLIERKTAYKPDYNYIIPIYIPIKEENKTVGESNFNTAVKKGVKAISLRSIKAKPDYGKPYNKLSKEEKEFYDKNEYNAFIDEVHLYMGDAYYQLNHLDSAEIQYQFITYEYPNNTTKHSAYLRLARIAIDREDFDLALSYLNLANHKLADNATIDAIPACYAHLYISMGKLKTAIPHLKAAINAESETTNVDYLLYDLAKIYDLIGDKKSAYKYFEDVESESEDYELILNAHISRIVLKTDEFSYNDAYEELLDLLDDGRNYEYQYKIYHFLGDLEFESNNVEKAVDYYKFSLKSNTSDKAQKILTSVKLGNILFNDNNYFRALQAYEIAEKNLTKDNPKYNEITEKIKNLKRITELSKIAFKDDKKQSYLLLDNQSGGLLDDVIIEEKEEEEESSLFGFMDFTESDKWYFYNKKIVKIGADKFKEIWGDVKLEDNWKYSNKETFFDEEEVIEEEIAGNSTEKIAVESNDKKQESKYANVTVSQAILELADIYNYRIKAKPKAFELFTKHLKKFPNSEKTSYVYYQLYMLAKEINMPHEQYRQALLDDYSETIYAKVVESEEKKRLIFSSKQEEQQYYNLTFLKYNEEKYQEVVGRIGKVSTDSKYKDKYDFLKVVSDYKLSGNKNKYKAELAKLKSSSKDTSIVEKANYLITNMSKRNEDLFRKEASELRQKILEEKEELTKEEIEKLFNFNREERHLFVTLLSSMRTKEVNLFKFELNTFNIEEAENIDLLVKNTYLGNNLEMVSVGAFIDMKKSCLYLESITNNMQKYESLKNREFLSFVISESNFLQLVKTGKIDEYMEFFFDKYDNIKFNN
jgi:tetratricopeptide (TPR) repeat protein